MCLECREWGVEKPVGEINEDKKKEKENKRRKFDNSLVLAGLSVVVGTHGLLEELEDLSLLEVRNVISADLDGKVLDDLLNIGNVHAELGLAHDLDAGASPRDKDELVSKKKKFFF